MSGKASTIQIRGLSVSYQRKRVLTNINLEVFPSSIYGVIGPNGAGKSTLFKSILGLVGRDAGDIWVLNSNIGSNPKKVAYVPQRDDVDWTFPATVFDVVLQGRYPHKKIFSRINAEDKHKAREALKSLEIEHLENRQIGQLSGGQQQRVFLARALAQEADILLLDEPFVGVDITTEEKIIAILKELAAMGKTLLVVHHDLSTVEAYFDNIILLNQRLIACGATKRFFTSEYISQCYGPQLPILNKLNFK